MPMFNNLITNFDYDLEDDLITIRIDTGGKLKLYMSQNLFCLYGCNCDLELKFTSDDLKDFFFKVQNQLYAGYQLVQWAQSIHDDLKKEAMQEAGDEDAHANDLCSPYLSGRI